MTIIDDTKVEEVHLTDEQVSHWLRTDKNRIDQFEYEGEWVTLANIDPQANLDLLPPARNEMRAFLNRALGTENLFHQQCGFRILTRPAEAVWTVFRHADTFLGIHDNGTLVARRFSTRGDHELRISEVGEFQIDGCVQTEEELNNLDVNCCIAAICNGVDAWTRRAKKRKSPLGFRRLLKRIEKLRQVNLLW